MTAAHPKHWQGPYDPLAAAVRAIAEGLMRQYERDYSIYEPMPAAAASAFEDDARTLLRLALPQLADAVREVAASGVTTSDHLDAVNLGAGLMSAALLLERWATNSPKEGHHA